MMRSGVTAFVPAAAVLSDRQASAWGEGVSIDRLAPLDRLLVRTRHSVYDIIVTSPDTGDVLVRGGNYFPAFTRARLAGSTPGGSLLKIRALHVGLRLEFALGRRYVRTSTVASITRASDAPAGARTS